MTSSSVDSVAWSKDWTWGSGEEELFGDLSEKTCTGEEVALGAMMPVPCSVGWGVSLEISSGKEMGERISRAYPISRTRTISKFELYVLGRGNAQRGMGDKHVCDILGVGLIGLDNNDEPQGWGDPSRTFPYHRKVSIPLSTLF